MPELLDRGRRWVDLTTPTSTLAHPWKGTHSHGVAVVRFRRVAPLGPRDDSRRPGVARECGATD